MRRLLPLGDQLTMKAYRLDGTLMDEVVPVRAVMPSQNSSSNTALEGSTMSAEPSASRSMTTGIQSTWKYSGSSAGSLHCHSTSFWGSNCS